MMTKQTLSVTECFDLSAAKKTIVATSYQTEGFGYAGDCAEGWALAHGGFTSYRRDEETLEISVWCLQEDTLKARVRFVEGSR